ncbi:hypothetical protein JOC54_001189 [Alkalihalobacillus xiaoxiensis]|uniref:Uncharacterized protein n=1 Tax=Shouchella xiaoxiensis TaxID=766895 RepID=A0ABS2SR44_9BACI|nr:hypothetical protein [Shouchella xiaoxiensis]MBM7837958.1 hypothetical protein [Shouchella xiaoxiensis]
MGTKELHSLCQQYTNYPVKLHLENGEEFESVVEYVDQENVHVLYPVDQNEYPMQITLLEGFQSMNQQSRFGPGYGPGFGYPPYGGYPGFRPYGWRRWVLPLTALTAIALL